mgnify:CR=1 FL=1
MWEFLAEYLSARVLITIGALVVLLRFRRYKAVGAAAVGVFSSAATIGVAVVVALFAIVALGYWEPPVGQIVGDVLGAGRTAYDLVGGWVLEQTVERLEKLAE